MLVCAAVPPCPFAMSPCTSTLSFACAPIGLRFGNLCKHSTVSFRPPSRNPGWHHAWYCIALSPETLHATSLQCPACASLLVRLRANWAAVRPSVQAPPPVIPASEPESWAALCGVLRCTAASLLSIPANASQGPVSAHGVTAQTRRLCHRAPLHCRPAPPRCHSLARQLGGGSATCASTVALTLHQLSGLRTGILGCLVRRRCPFSHLPPKTPCRSTG